MATPDHPGDFGTAWFGARALLHQANPYALVGPGLVYEWPWNILYPVPAMLVAMPFAILPQLVATLAFVFVSAGLLAYSITADGWYRMPMFVSASFLVAAGSAQWSPLLTAALAIPALAVIIAAKPNIGVALFVAGTESVQKAALIGFVVLTAIGLALFPEWPRAWLANIGATEHMAPPVARLGGVACLLAALRWRRPEARLVLALSLVPQTGSWYEILPLFLVASDLRESMVLCTISSLGFVLEDHLLTATTEVEFNAQVGALIVALAYLPAVIMILRRPNEGYLPGWLRGVTAIVRRYTGTRSANGTTAR